MVVSRGAILVGPTTLELTYGSGSGSGNLYLDVNGDFSMTTKVDDWLRFTPGADLNLNDVPPTSGGNLRQEVWIHVVPGVTRGEVTLRLDNVSQHRGNSMNGPVPNSSDTTLDMEFGPGMYGPMTVTIPKSGNVKVPLYILDYAASGTLTVTMPKSSGKGTVTVSKQLPWDANNNGISDAGWKASGVLVSDTASDTATDVDATPASEIAGDGFTVFDEYRGYLDRLVHRRTHPGQKDLFLSTSATTGSVFMPTSQLADVHGLGLKMHSLLYQDLPGESAPVVNTNSASTPQAGMRLRTRRAAPLEKATTGEISKSEAQGWVFLVGEDAELIDRSLDVLPNDLNESQAAEIFLDNIERYILFDGTDPESIIIRECTGEYDPNFPCDRLLARAIDAGEDGWQTELRGNDYYGFMADDCFDAEANTPVFSARGVAEAAKVAVTGHEAGHALSLAHAAKCERSIMHEFIRLPLEHAFSGADLGQIRLRGER